ncbi:MAG: ribonuclease D [Rhodothermales bacterium]
MIDTPQQLENLIDRARQARRVALDTEFVWERTYYAGLGLVQLGLSRDEVYLIDTVAIDDLSALGALIADPDVVKILHDAQQDLMILYRATGGAPRSIFDTRLAGGFVGLTATTSLQALIGATVDVHLPKGESRSDWLRRPLREAQLEYARDDVRYLPDAFDVLWARIDALDRRAWVEEEMAQYDDLSLYTEDDPFERYRSVKGRGKRGFSPLDYAVLRELTAWREQEARHRDRPRGHIVKDDVLVTLAQRKPTNDGALRDVQGVSDNAVRNYGDAIVEAVKRGLDVPKSDRPKPTRRRRKDDTEIARFDLAQALIKGRSLSHEIDPGLIGNRASVERLVAAGPGADPAEHPVLRGWRREFVGEAVLDLLRGEGSVSVDPETDLPRLVPNSEQTPS